MSSESPDKEKDCISRCQEEFLDCVENSGPVCVANFEDCTGACER